MDKDQKSIGHKSDARKNDRLRKKNYFVHYETNNWMIVIGDGKAMGHKMMTDKIIELDQLLIPSSQMAKNEAAKFVKRTKTNNEGWITLGKKMLYQLSKWSDRTCLPL